MATWKTNFLTKGKGKGKGKGPNFLGPGTESTKPGGIR